MKSPRELYRIAGRKYQIGDVKKELRAIEECLGVALSSCDASRYKINLRIHKTREIVTWKKLLSTGFVDRIGKIWSLFTTGFS